MSTMELSRGQCEDFLCRPRRHRTDSQRGFSAQNLADKTLEVEGVIKVLNTYDETEGGINCSVCGKLYKSKVCLTKHLWEHSVYWDMFAGEKNHDRVLSIQAAIILCSGHHDNQSMTSLLVTSPHEKKPKTPEKDQTKEMSKEKDNGRQHRIPPAKRKLSMKGKRTPQKRRRTTSGSDSGIASSSDTEQPTKP